jgi:hypothetical protein
LAIEETLALIRGCRTDARRLIRLSRGGEWRDDDTGSEVSRKLAVRMLRG